MSESSDGLARCGWANGSAQYLAYHDREWGVPVHDDRTLFEFIVLEGAQAGLSWATILAKREGYRRLFDHFDPHLVAAYTPARIERMLQDSAIVRNRAKVKSAVGNARAVLELQAEYGSFDRFIWDFVDGKPVQNKWRSLSEVPASSAQSDAMSKALKKRGFKFVGTTICYAYMQAVGMVNDHTVACFRRIACRDAHPAIGAGGNHDAQ